MEEFLLPCLFKSLSGFDCPGCGLQRSLLLLFQGRFWESVHMYWATIPILLLFAATAFQLYFKLRWGPRALIFLYAATAVLIVCQYIYKLAHQVTA